jgi:hypothetical protein
MKQQLQLKPATAAMAEQVLSGMLKQLREDRMAVMAVMVEMFMPKE